MNGKFALLLLFAFSAALSAYDFSVEPVSPADSSTSSSPQVAFQFIYHKGATGPDSIACNVVASDKIAGSTSANDNAVASVTAILPAGSYVWQVSCRDAVNETSSPPRTVSVIADPHVYLDSPQPDAAFQAGQQVALSYFYSASGGSPSASCMLLLDGSEIHSGILQTDEPIEVAPIAQLGAGAHTWMANCELGGYHIQSEARIFSIAHQGAQQNETAPPSGNDTNKTSGNSPPGGLNDTPPGVGNALPGGENSNPSGLPGSQAPSQSSPPSGLNLGDNPAAAGSAGAASGNPAASPSASPNQSRNASAQTGGIFPPGASKPDNAAAGQGASPVPPGVPRNENNQQSVMAQGADGGTVFLLAIAIIVIAGAACFLKMKKPAAPEEAPAQKKAKRKKSA